MPNKCARVIILDQSIAIEAILRMQTLKQALNTTTSVDIDILRRGLAR